MSRFDPLHGKISFHRAVRVPWAAVVMLALAGCGGGKGASNGAGPTLDSGSQATAATTVRGGSTQPTGPVTTGPPTTQAGSLLKRRDVPPEGIKAQFEFFQEGDGSCRGLDKSRPGVIVEFPKPTIGSMFVICFPGFAPNRPVQVEVQLPNGTTRRMEVDEYDIDEKVAEWFWYSLPGDPIGIHRVTATQGSLRGTGTFTVARASAPRLLVAPPQAGPPGTTFRVGMAGFTPGSDVLFYLYRKGDGPYQYVTSFTVRMDGNGEALYAVTTSANDPKGSYCLLFRGPKAAPDYACGGLSGFTIT